MEFSKFDWWPAFKAAISNSATGMQVAILDLVNLVGGPHTSITIVDSVNLVGGPHTSTLVQYFNSGFSKLGWWPAYKYSIIIVDSVNWVGGPHKGSMIVDSINFKTPF